MVKAGSVHDSAARTGFRRDRNMSEISNAKETVVFGRVIGLALVLWDCKGEAGSAQGERDLRDGPRSLAHQNGLEPCRGLQILAESGERGRRTRTKGNRVRPHPGPLLQERGWLRGRLVSRSGPALSPTRT